MLTTATREREVKLPEEVQKRYTNNQLTGADVIAMWLIRNGAQRNGAQNIPGITGGSIVNLSNALDPWITDGFVNPIISSHEDPAVYTAMGNAIGEKIVTGEDQPGVAVVSAGPAPANFQAAIWSAYKERIPVIAITGQLSTDKINTGAFQDYPITETVLPITPGFYRILDPRKIPRIIDRTFDKTRRYRIPYVLDIPIDVQQAHVDKTILEEYLLGAQNQAFKKEDTSILPEEELDITAQIARDIDKTEKVLFVFGKDFGQGIDSAHAKLIVETLAENGHVPFTGTMTALDSYPQNNDLYIGRDNPRVKEAMKTAQLIIGFGTNFTDGSSADPYAGNPNVFHPQATVISINDTPDIRRIKFKRDTSKNPKVDISINANPRAIAKALSYMLKGKERAEWLQQVTRPKPTIPAQDSYFPIRTQDIHQLSEVAQDNAIFLPEASDIASVTAECIDWRKSRRLITLRETGPMGYALPLAIGLKLAAPEIPLYLLSGDRSPLMTLAEFATLKELMVKGLIKGAFGIMLFDDAGFGKVRRSPHNGRPSCTDFAFPPNFSAILNGFGIRNEHMTDSNARPYIARMRDANEPYVLWRQMSQYPLVA